MAQAGGHPCSKTASPGIPRRSGGSLQKRRRLPGPQNTAEAPPLGTPNTGSAAKLGGLAPHATGRVDHAGNTCHEDLCEIPTKDRTVHSLPDISGTLLGKHIGSIRPHKAVPTGSAPAAAWKLCASSAGASLATHLSSQAGHRPCPATEALEAPLKDADMCLSPNHLSQRQPRATFDRSESFARMGKG